jgi:hypothetical protein
MPDTQKDPEIEETEKEDYGQEVKPLEEEDEGDDDFDDGEPDEDEDEEDEDELEDDDSDEEDESDEDEPQELLDMTRAHIEQRIDKIAYVKLPSGKGHVCELLMKNGFLIIGGQVSELSTPVLPKESKAKAYERAFKKAWEFEAYALAERNCAGAYR